MRVFFVLVLCLAAVAAKEVYPRNEERIVGGSLTTISQHPYGSSMLYTWNQVNYFQACGGGIITNTAILSAAHCFFGDAVSRWRVRVGSHWANSGGVVHTLRSIVIHPNYDNWNLNNDIAVLRTATSITYVNNAVINAPIASSTYNLADNTPVWAIGWGLTSFQGQSSEQLRHVQVWTINQNTCRSRHSELGFWVSDNMLCSGWLDVGGRGQCNGDSGSPVLHVNGNNRVIVGVTSWGYNCATARYGSVNARVSRFTNWIVAAAS